MCSSNAQTLNSGGGTTLALDQLHMGDDHQVSQLVHGNAVQQVIDGIIAVQGNGSFQRSTDGLFCTGLLQHLLDLVTDSNELCPLGLEGIVCSVLACLGHCLEHNVLVHAFGLGQEVPDLLAGEAEDGGNDLVQSDQDLVHGGLGSLAAHTVGAVQAVFRHIQVEVGHSNNAEVVDGVIDLVEVIHIIACLGIHDQVIQSSQCPAVDLLQLVICHTIGVGVKAIQIAQNEAGGVTDLAVSLAQLLEDILTGAHIHSVVGRSDPQADDIRTVVLDDLAGLHAVAGALVHLLALLVHNPAVAQNGLIRCAALGSHAGQQAGLEPTAELVAALHIHVGREAQLRALLQNGSMGGTGIEPDIHDVGILGPLGSAALLADFTCGDDLLCLVLVPGIGAFLAEQRADSLDGGIGDVVSTALLAVESRDGHTPGTLTADAPVVAVTDHALHAVVAPVRHPLHGVDGLVDIVTELGNRAEPLLGGTEDDGVVAAPAVGVLMLDVHLTHDGTSLGQVGQNGLVGSPDTLTCVLAGQLRQAAAVVHGNSDGHVVLLRNIEVIHAVAACGVDAAGTAFQRDMVTQDDGALLGQIDVVVAHQLELSAGNRLAHDLVVLNMAGIHHALDQLGGHDMVLLADLDKGILKGTVQADGLVGGQGPGGGGPDHEVGLIHRDAVLCQHTVGVLRYMEADEDGIAVVLAVLDLCLSQSGAAVGAPVHGLQALVDVALLGHLAKDLDLAGLELRLQGQVGVLKVTDNAQTLELVAHNVDMLGGKLFADLAQLQLGDVLLFLAQRGQSLQLNG